MEREVSVLFPARSIGALKGLQLPERWPVVIEEAGGVGAGCWLYFADSSGEACMINVLAPTNDHVFKFHVIKSHISLH